jgi:hypothetical protein
MGPETHEEKKHKINQFLLKDVKRSSVISDNAI